MDNFTVPGRGREGKEKGLNTENNLFVKKTAYFCNVHLAVRIFLSHVQKSVYFCMHQLPDP